MKSSLVKKETLTKKMTKKVRFEDDRCTDKELLDEADDLALKQQLKIEKLYSVFYNIKKSLNGVSDSNEKFQMSSTDSMSLLANDQEVIEKTPAKSWNCMYCDAKYKGKAWLNTHMEKHHADQLNASCETSLSESQFEPIRNSTTEEIATVEKRQEIIIIDGVA